MSQEPPTRYENDSSARLGEAQRTPARMLMNQGVDAMPYDLIDHPGQIQLFNVLHLFFTTVCSSQIIVASAKDFLANGLRQV